ncbi:MAG: hypothetical protein ACJ79R_19880 [Anaeromyxobacteraceae bacterium]
MLAGLVVAATRALNEPVLPSVRALAVSRVAAALVALALSGALQLGRADEGHPARAAAWCRCGAHGAAQACRGCRSARARGSDKAPPCHGAAARDGLARDERAPGSTAPCVKGSCGEPEAPQATGARVVETFTVPVVEAPVRRDVIEDVPPALAVAYGVGARPETPPPRVG